MANTLFPLIIFAIPLAIAVPVVILSFRLAKRRTQEFSDVAQQIGFKFLGSTWRGPALSPVHKMCIIQSTRGGFKNVMIGSIDGLEAALFDYTYMAGKSSVTITLASFTQGKQLPAFELRSESIFDRIGDALVHRDIDFDSNPEFSRRYFLRSPDEAGVRNLFTPTLLSYFEQIPSDRKWHVETSANTLIVYQYQQLMKAAELPLFLGDASAIARTIFGAAR